jgi:hypothetical protein
LCRLALEHRLTAQSDWWTRRNANDPCRVVRRTEAARVRVDRGGLSKPKCRHRNMATPPQRFRQMAAEAARTVMGLKATLSAWRDGGD